MPLTLVGGACHKLSIDRTTKFAVLTPAQSMLSPAVQFLTYGMVQVIGLELMERITWTTQVLG